MQKESDLVVINRNKAVASHVIISKGMEVTQNSTLKLIKKYKNELLEFGRVRFEITPFETNGGIQKRKEFMLDEHQAMFLLTLMRNNPKTVQFKKRLVKQYAEMQFFISSRAESSVEFRVMSGMLEQSRDLEGKKTKSYHYSNEARMVNWALTGNFQPLNRNSLAVGGVSLLNKLQLRNTMLLAAGKSYQDRKEALSLFVARNKTELSGSSTTKHQLPESH